MPRALSDIMTELDTTYNPLRNRSQQIYNKGIEATNPQETADLAGLEVAKNNAFGQAETRANRRGVFFSGIPIQEQAQYIGENYLPSVAGLKNRYAGIRGNLYQTLAQQLGQYDVEQEKRKYEIYNSEIAQEQEAARLAAEREAAARASAGGGFSPTLGGLGGAISGGPQTLGATNVKPEDQMLYNQMFVKGDGSMWTDQDLVNDYNATYQSAKYGNVRDQKKLQFYHNFRSDLFGSKPQNPATNAGSGGGGW